MANEDIDRIKANQERPKPTPEGFKAELNNFELELTPSFMEAATELSPDSGVAQIITAQAELSQRLRILSEGLIENPSEADIAEVMNYFGISIGRVKMAVEAPYIVGSITKLRHVIVRSPQYIRETMVRKKILTDEARRELSELDKQSSDFADLIESKPVSFGS